MKNDMPERDFDTIYEQYSRLVYWAAYRVLSDKEMAEDVTQNVFMTVLKSMDTVAGLPDAQLKGWLYRVSVNAAVDAKRRHGKEVLSDEPVGAEVADSGGTPEDEALLSDTRAAVRRALAEMDDIYKEPLTMYYFSEMSVLEIAAALGVSEGTVKSRMARGRNMMAQKLRKMGISYE